jgi:ADP-ribose pyrophosphatase YjhB (NUDIX family)
MKEIIKVTAYITCSDKLLVFRHVDYPEAGIQVPSGTAEDGEKLEDAVLREAEEECGLKDLELITYLGKANYTFDPPGEKALRIQRYYYHLSWPGPIQAERWQHWEESPSVGEEKRILFELFWVNQNDVPELSGKLGLMLDKLSRQEE